MAVSVTLVLMEIAQRRMVKLSWPWFVPWILITAIIWPVTIYIGRVLAPWLLLGIKNAQV